MEQPAEDQTAPGAPEAPPAQPGYKPAAIASTVTIDGLNLLLSCTEEDGISEDNLSTALETYGRVILDYVRAGTIGPPPTTDFLPEETFAAPKAKQAMCKVLADNNLAAVFGESSTRGKPDRSKGTTTATIFANDARGDQMHNVTEALIQALQHGTDFDVKPHLAEAPSFGWSDEEDDETDKSSKPPSTLTEQDAEGRETVSPEGQKKGSRKTKVQKPATNSFAGLPTIEPAAKDVHAFRDIVRQYIPVPSPLFTEGVLLDYTSYAAGDHVDDIRSDASQASTAGRQILEKYMVYMGMVTDPALKTKHGEVHPLDRLFVALSDIDPLCMVSFVAELLLGTACLRGSAASIVDEIVYPNPPKPRGPRTPAHRPDTPRVDPPPEIPEAEPCAGPPEDAGAPGTAPVAAKNSQYVQCGVGSNAYMLCAVQLLHAMTTLTFQGKHVYARLWVAEYLLEALCAVGC